MPASVTTRSSLCRLGYRRTRRLGDVMSGTGGARKVRFAGKGKGKSGGYRTIHYYGGNDVPLFLLALIDKGDRANLTKAERNALAAELSCLADDYRAGVAARLTTLKRRI